MKSRTPQAIGISEDSYAALTVYLGMEKPATRALLKHVQAQWNVNIKSTKGEYVLHLPREEAMNETFKEQLEQIFSDLDISYRVVNHPTIQDTDTMFLAIKTTRSAMKHLHDLFEASLLMKFVYMDEHAVDKDEEQLNANWEPERLYTLTVNISPEEHILFSRILRKWHTIMNGARYNLTYNLGEEMSFISSEFDPTEHEKMAPHSHVWSLKIDHALAKDNE